MGNGDGLIRFRRLFVPVHRAVQAPPRFNPLRSPRPGQSQARYTPNALVSVSTIPTMISMCLAANRFAA